MKSRRIREAIEILTALGMPPAQRNERSALTLLALAEIKKHSAWKDARRPLVRIWDIMSFIRDEYGKNYAANTRETIRRQTIHQFEQARIVDRNPDDPNRPTNSGRNVYAVTAEALALVRAYGSGRFAAAVAAFIRKFGTLQAAYQNRRTMHSVPLKLPGAAPAYLSPGAHNQLQVAVVEQFGPVSPPARPCCTLATLLANTWCAPRSNSQLSGS